MFSPPDDEITKSTDPRVLCSGGCELPGEMGRTYQLLLLQYALHLINACIVDDGMIVHKSHALLL